MTLPVLGSPSLRADAEEQQGHRTPGDASGAETRAASLLSDADLQGAGMDLRSQYRALTDGIAIQLVAVPAVDVDGDRPSLQLVHLIILPRPAGNQAQDHLHPVGQPLR
jgi:hypothetical protein